MAHHWTETPEFLRQFQDAERVANMDRLKSRTNELERVMFGPTGLFPEGKLNERDEGEIRVGIAADVPKQRVFLNLGKPVACIGLTYDQAMALSDSFRDEAWKLRGIVG